MAQGPTDAPLVFRKMHGLGNDFVIVDARAEPVSLSDAAVRAIADRHPLPVHDAAHAHAGFGTEVRHFKQRDVAVRDARDDGRGEGVFTGTLK